MAIQKLSAEQIEAALKDRTQWTVRDGKLHREFQFPDFVHAFGFMATAAIAIEKLNHHPEWSNVYSRVTVDLTTHDADGITERDFRLAEILDTLAEKLAR